MRTFFIVVLFFFFGSIVLIHPIQYATARSLYSGAPQEMGLVRIPTVRGLIIETRQGEEYLRSNVVAALVRVADYAARDGYTIIVQAAYRSRRRQLQIAHGAPASRIGMTIARPGNSRHGFGIAVDATLGDSRGRDLIGLNMRSALQCSLSEEKMRHLRRLSNYFFAAGWKRLHTESWHFEYGSTGCRVSTCSGYASLCGKKGVDDCRRCK